MKIFQLIIGCILALGFMGVGIYGLRKGWKGRHITYCLIACISMFLISLDWVQGFVQTQAFTSLLSASKKYGEKLNEFQKTTGEMKVQLSKHQDDINNQQAGLSLNHTAISVAQGRIEAQQKQTAEQQGRISQQQATLDAQEREMVVMQRDLAETQDKIIQQQKQIEGVEFLVKNLFEKTRSERFFTSDTNRVFFLEKKDGATVVFLKLSECPIPESVSIFFENIPSKPGTISSLNNVVFTTVGGKPDDFKAREINVGYVADTQKQGVSADIYVLDAKVFLNNREFDVDTYTFK